MCRSLISSVPSIAILSLSFPSDTAVCFPNHLDRQHPSNSHLLLLSSLSLDDHSSSIAPALPLQLQRIAVYLFLCATAIPIRQIRSTPRQLARRFLLAHRRHTRHVALCNQRQRSCRCRRKRVVAATIGRRRPTGNDDV